MMRVVLRVAPRLTEEERDVAQEERRQTDAEPQSWMPPRPSMRKESGAAAASLRPSMGRSVAWPSVPECAPTQAASS